MAETSEKETSNGTAAAVIEPTAVPSPNPEVETDQPITRTTTTVDKMIVRPKRGRPSGMGHQQLSTTPTRNLCAALIDDVVCKDPIRYKVNLSRISPNFSQFGDLVPQGPMSEIREFAKREKGPGTYRIKVLQDGILVPVSEGGSCDFEVESVKVEAAVTEDTEDLKSVKIQTQKIIEQKRQAEAQRELERAKREMEAEALEAKRNAEESPLLAVVEKLAAKVEALSQPKQTEWTIEKIAVLITAAAPILQMFKPEKDNSIKEVLQTINESNRQQTEKLMKLLEQKSEKNKDELSVLEIYMKVKKELREENKEFQDRLAALSSSRGGDDEDIDIDPNNIWGSLAAAGVKGIIHLFKTGGPGMVEAITTIAANVGKKPEQLTTADEPSVQAAIAEAAAAQRTRLPVGPITAQPPQMQRAPLGPPRILKLPPLKPIDPAAPTPILKNASLTTDGAAQPGATPAPTPPENAGVAPVAVEQDSAPVVGASATGVPVTETSSLPVAPLEFKLSSQELEDDLKLEIDKSIGEMILDIESGRTIGDFSAQIWIDEATRRWNADFLKYLTTLETHMTAYKVIRSKADKESLDKLDNALMAYAQKADAEKPGEAKYLWSHFHTGFKLLIETVRERRKERDA